MFIFIRLIAIFLMAVVAAIIFTQIIIPSLNGTKSWPYFRKQGIKKLRDIKEEIDNMDTNITIQGEEEVLLDKQAKYKNNQQELNRKRKELNNK